MNVLAPYRTEGGWRFRADEPENRRGEGPKSFGPPGVKYGEGEKNKIFEEVERYESVEGNTLSKLTLQGTVRYEVPFGSVQRSAQTKKKKPKPSR